MTKEEKIQILRETVDIKGDIFLALQKIGCQTGIEIGVRRGGNLKTLSNNREFAKGKLIGMDCWQEVVERPTFNDQSFSQKALDAQYESVKNLFEAYNWVEIIRDFSVEGSQRFEDGYFDFCYLDAAHDYQSIKEDLAAWWPKIKSGGILSGHDWFPDHRVWRGEPVGVYKAVAEFCEEKSTEVHHHTDCEREGGKGHCCPSFFIVKD